MEHHVEAPNLEDVLTYTPNFDFMKKKEVTIEDFFKTLYVQFAWYRANQRIPRLDGLAETQRKVVWTALKNNYIKKEKLSIVYADALKTAQYHHGDKSFMDTANNMIAEYKNNLPVLRPDGSFGSRSLREAAAERYTSTRIFPFIKTLYNEEDVIATLSYRTIENKPAEPLTLFPLLPMALINGQKQTAVGYATNILPRSVKTIMDLFIGILKGEITQIPAYIQPEFPFYNGKIEIMDDNKWENKGIIKRDTSRNQKKFIIEEVTYQMDKPGLVAILQKLKEDKVIDDFVDETNDNTFKAVIKAPGLWDKTDEEVLKIFGLTTSITEYFTIINDSDNKFRTDCKDIGTYINYFFVERLKVYEARKQYRIAKLNFDLIRKVSLINYLNEVIQGNIEIRNKTEEEVIAQLKSYGPEYQFFPQAKTFVYGQDPFNGPNANFDYLFSFTTRAFTPKKLAALNEEYQTAYATLQGVQETAAAAIWLEDLEKFKKEITKFGFYK